MKNYIYLILTVILLISFSNNAISQEVGKIITIETKDGNFFTGKVVNQTDKLIRISTKSAGTISIKKDAIKSIDKKYLEITKENDTNKKYRSFPSRYFIGSSGYNLKKGEAYYSNTWIFFNDISYGITDHFSIGMGVIPLFLMGDAPTPVWLKTKLSYPIIENKLNISGGIMGITVLGVDYDDVGFVGFIYGAATIGSKDKNFTIGLQYGYGDGDVSPPFITFSGKYKITKRTYLIADNFFSLFDSDITILSLLGARTMFKGISLDYGGIIPFGSEFLFGDGISVFPYLGINIGFGNR